MDYEDNLKVIPNFIWVLLFLSKIKLRKKLWFIYKLTLYIIILSLNNFITSYKASDINA